MYTGGKKSRGSEYQWRLTGNARRVGRPSDRFALRAQIKQGAGRHTYQCILARLSRIVRSGKRLTAEMRGAQRTRHLFADADALTR